MNLIFRPATPDDTYANFQVFLQSVMELGERLGTSPISGGHNAEGLKRLWETRRPLMEHLASTAEQYWVAERDQQIIGYARSLLRGNVRQLTDFFVLPGEQSGGIGRELLARAFPSEGAKRRLIIASIDIRAQVRYMKAGMYPRSPIYYFSREPEDVTVESNLNFKRIYASPHNLSTLNRLDESVLGYQREVDHRWLLNNRQGFLYLRGVRPVGYGYLAANGGPYALLDERDFPAVLAHAEREALLRGDTFGVEVPAINRVAVDYLLKRGCHMDSFIEFLMSDAPFGKFENYILTTPPFFI